MTNVVISPYIMKLCAMLTIDVDIVSELLLSFLFCSAFLRLNSLRIFSMGTCWYVSCSLVANGDVNDGFWEYFCII